MLQKLFFAQQQAAFAGTPAATAFGAAGKSAFSGSNSFKPDLGLGVSGSVPAGVNLHQPQAPTSLGIGRQLDLSV